MPATIFQINVSRGGVPKVPVETAVVTRLGLAGDAQADLEHHGGPDRAVSLFSLEVIRALNAEGHPISPGSAGENLTIQGLDWPAIVPGTRLVFSDGVELEIASFCGPCSTIRGSFKDLSSKRIKQEFHPGFSRLYARVLCEGAVSRGEGVSVRIQSPPTPATE